MYDCGKAGLCTPWVLDKCTMCDFTPATSLPQNPTSPPTDEPSISSPIQKSEDYNHCAAEWLKYKCAHDCPTQNLCTPWVHVQCGTCNFAANNVQQPPVNIPHNVQQPPVNIPQVNAENVDYFCSTTWLKAKCLYDCEANSDLCTHWVHAQCKRCNL